MARRSFEPARKAWPTPALPTRTAVHSPGVSGAHTDSSMLGAGQYSVAPGPEARKLARSQPDCT